MPTDIYVYTFCDWGCVYSGLRGNALTGMLSPDMCQLTGLWYLWVVSFFPVNVYKNWVFPFNTYNYIWMILVVFIDFSDVRGNNLTGTIPDSIGNCTSFEILYVIYCTLHWILCLHFSVLINFLIVGNFRDISYNQITGEIPYNIGFLQVATLWAFSTSIYFSY